LSNYLAFYVVQAEFIIWNLYYSRDDGGNENDLTGFIVMRMKRGSSSYLLIFILYTSNSNSNKIEITITIHIFGGIIPMVYLGCGDEVLAHAIILRFDSLHSLTHLCIWLRLVEDERSVAIPVSSSFRKP
jgi:hypothetical protein